MGKVANYVNHVMILLYELGCGNTPHAKIIYTVVPKTDACSRCIESQLQTVCTNQYGYVVRVRDSVVYSEMRMSRPMYRTRYNRLMSKVKSAYGYPSRLTEVNK